VTVGQSYASLVTIDATDANAGDVISYNVTSAPTGISVDASGVISWSNVEFSQNATLVISVSDGVVRMSGQRSGFSISVSGQTFAIPKLSVF